VTKTAPHLPASEVIRFGLQLVLRLTIATFVGLIVMKAGQAIGSWADAAAITYGQSSVALLFLGSFFLRPVPFPEIDYGPDPEPSATDE